VRRARAATDITKARPALFLHPCGGARDARARARTTTSPPRATMPCYQLILFAKPEAAPERLAALLQSVARVVYRESGQFRRFENLGVRPLAYPLRKGGTAYGEVRWMHATYDLAPPALAAVGAAIQADKDVLQYRHVLSTEPLAAFRNRPAEERLKKPAGARRWAAEHFDPDTLSFRLATPSKDLA
jgi:ribosomal protein S6